ncbi:MAG TPA: SUF system NifU family Fe-S cluster assembly protein [Phototrophicaceae bacterium]|nr:SUF system NifU family Fe-S cluster assembly protein [Phototrophicaceae bacterium]
MQDMYRENILDHARHMSNKGILDPADIDYEAHNPLCGDRLRLTLRVDADNRVTEVGWDGEGCAISQASASMLGEEILGKTLEEIRAIDKEQIFEMLGIPIGMNRVKCALLSLKVLKVGLYGLEEWRKLEHEDEKDE